MIECHILCKKRELLVQPWTTPLKCSSVITSKSTQGENCKKYVL